MHLKFWRKHRTLKVEKEEKPKEKSLLEELGERYGVPYSVLSISLPLDPSGRNISELERKGAEYEELFKTVQDPINQLRARAEYWSALGVALYKGDSNLIKKISSKCAELAPLDSEYRKGFEYLTKEENIEKVKSLAKEYYEKTLKPVEEKS